METKKINFSRESITLKEAENFWLKVGEENVRGCWPWIGHSTSRGYGLIKFRRQYFSSHRFAWFLARGSDPESLFVLHRCDNPKCCRPSHLFLGTNKENSVDSQKKGRRARKLTEESVKKIRQLLAEGHTLRSLASQFGITSGTVWSIKKRKIWEHIAP